MNTGGSPTIVQTYLYARMHYNKFCKKLSYWWQTYLFFKCSVLVLPAYTILIISGVYCLWRNIEVPSVLKTIYEVLFLLLSALAIFIIVLLLATINGDKRDPNDPREVDIDAELDDAIQKLSVRASASGRNRNSLSSSIMSTIFGNYYDFDDLEDVYLDPEEIITIANETSTRNCNISSALDSLEQGVERLDYFLDQAAEQALDMGEDNEPMNQYRLSSIYEGMNIAPLLSSSYQQEMNHYNDLLTRQTLREMPPSYEEAIKNA